jgi:peptidyl-prolyl cis-trans isomerase C
MSPRTATGLDTRSRNARAQHKPYTAANGRMSGSSGFFLRVLREPLVHFVLLGAILFSLNHALEERTRFNRVTVTKDQVDRLANNYRLQFGDFPSSSQLETLVNKYIDEEILYREALKLGLDREDEIVRRRLVQKYEFLRQDLSTSQGPTNAQLEDYHRRHLDQYRLPERVTFTQVYFSVDHRGDEGARRAAEALASSLNRRGITRAVDQGDRFPGPDDFTSLSQEELVRVFGEDGLAQDIFGVEPKRWSAPLRSGYGWHTLYVSLREPARRPAFAEVRDRVEQDCIESMRAQRNAQGLASLRAQFTIERQ